MKICISNKVVEFEPSEKRKNFQRKLLQRMRSVYNRSTIVNNPSECLPSVLSTSMQSQNIIRSTYIDNNNLYQGLIPQKTIIISIIITLRPSKYHQTVIEQQPDTSPNVTKASEILLIPGGYDMFQHIIPINKSVLQDIFSLEKIILVQIFTQEIICNIILPWILLILRWIAPLNFSGWGYPQKKEWGQIDYSRRQ